jgi:phosphoglycerol transferase MdoB-like AlkP superfamily enzyme
MKFFAEAEKQPWFNNTLFIITGDHTQKSDDPQYANEMGHYRVPLVLYHPKIQLPEISGREILQHTDIMPTVLDLLGLPNPTRLGQSAFSKGKKFAVNRGADGYWYLDDDVFIRMSFDNKIHAWRHRNLEVLESLPEDAVAESVIRLKAYIQYYQNSVIENSFASPVLGY